MTEIISKLRKDHCHLVKIFDLIERELDAIGESNEPNFALLSHILEYIKYYPDVFHHPLEDFVFDFLLRHDETRPAVERLEDEHLAIAEKTKAFRDAVIRLEETADAALREQVISLGRAYLDLQRKHLTVEESVVFPQAIALLTEAEWQAVRDYAAMTSPLADPVFGPSVKARYEELKQRIERHA